MKFKINGNEWEIKEKKKEELLEEYRKIDEEALYAFGVTKYPEHEIWINKEMCYSQRIKTLKHELTHCYIWEYGFYNVPNFNEEMVCDLVAGSNDIVNEVVKRFKEEKSKETEVLVDRGNVRTLDEMLCNARPDITEVKVEMPKSIID